MRVSNLIIFGTPNYVRRHSNCFYPFYLSILIRIICSFVPFILTRSFPLYLYIYIYIYIYITF